jgi:hypothetical protein
VKLDNSKINKLNKQIGYAICRKNKTIKGRKAVASKAIFVQGERKPNLFEFAEPQPKMAQAICRSIRDRHANVPYN